LTHIDEAALVELARRRLRRLGRSSRVPAAASNAVRALARLPDRHDARRFLLGHVMQGWLFELEQAVRLCSAARCSRQAVFELVLDTVQLQRLVPRGRADRDLPRRAARLGRALLARALAELPLIAAVWVRPRQALRARIRPAADAELGRPSGELWLGAGELVLRRRARSAVTVKGVLDGHGLRLRPASGWRIEPGAALGDSAIRVGNRVYSDARGQRVGGRDRRAELRLGRALALVDRAWPAAGGWLRRRTTMVVPLEEAGTVSYSQMVRPGLSYIVTRGKRIVQLADDLVHENAHHELHLREQLGALERSDGSPVLYSPWRRSLRPVRGLLHACFTFLRRAELFLRLLDCGPRRPELRRGSMAGAMFLARGVLEEMAALEFSLTDLKRIGRYDLTAAGRVLLDEMTADLDRLAPEVAVIRNRLRRGRNGRELLLWERAYRRRLDRLSSRWNSVGRPSRPPGGRDAHPT
jgi:HEXXH motif-containing protein